MEGLKVEKKPDKTKASSSPKHKPAESQAKEMDYIGLGYQSPERFVPLLAKLSHPANMTPRMQFFSQLQRSYGNRYVQRMVQTKLKVGKPGDIYEKEADRVAEQVMRKEADEVIVSNEAQPSLMGYAGEEDGVSEGTIRSIESQRGKGQPLSASSRAFFEPRFGYDFGQVRLHTGSRAADMAASLGAQAFTYGSDVWLGRGESPANSKLLAHELTHVVQQRGIVQKKEGEGKEGKGKKEPEEEYEEEEEPTEETAGLVSVKKGVYRVKATASGWAPVKPSYILIKRGEPFELPHFCKVEVTEPGSSSSEIDIKEAKYKGKDANIENKYLMPDPGANPSASVIFNISAKQLWYGGSGPVETITDETNPTPAGTHDLEIPDFHHKGGSRYGKYGTTWFRVEHSGDRYLHPGRRSAGCVTVKDTTKWPSIYAYLISARLDDKSVGTIQVV
jgi:hypothetical protein